MGRAEPAVRAVSGHRGAGPADQRLHPGLSVRHRPGGAGGPPPGGVPGGAPGGDGPGCGAPYGPGTAQRGPGRGPAAGGLPHLGGGSGRSGPLSDPEARGDPCLYPPGEPRLVLWICGGGPDGGTAGCPAGPGSGGPHHPGGADRVAGPGLGTAGLAPGGTRRR